VRSILLLCAVLAFALVLLRRPVVNGWIGYLRPGFYLLVATVLLFFQIRDFLRGDGEEDASGSGDQVNLDGSKTTRSVTVSNSRIMRGSVFGGVEVGCVGATFLVIFTVLCAAGLLAMVWWPYLHK
jgi:hypothetical protein